jgi:hypothetical protein
MPMMREHITGNGCATEKFFRPQWPSAATLLLRGGSDLASQNQ